MRVLAWILIALGILFAALSLPYARAETARRIHVWATHERETAAAELDIRRLERQAAMLQRGEVPAWTIASPWPGVLVGFGISAFGLLLLAIRRPVATKNCPSCGKSVSLEARYCPSCGQDQHSSVLVPPVTAEVPDVRADKDKRAREVQARLDSLIRDLQRLEVGRATDASELKADLLRRITELEDEKKRLLAK